MKLTMTNTTANFSDALVVTLKYGRYLKEIFWYIINGLRIYLS